MSIARISFLYALIAATASADAITLRTGVGVNHSADSALYSVGYEDEITYNSPLVYRFDIGGWTDQIEGRKSSPFVTSAAGVRLGDPSGLALQLTLGASVIGFTDSTLGGNFEFNECGGVQLWFVRPEYCHWSNAGLSNPNHGRDYVALAWVFRL